MVRMKKRAPSGEGFYHGGFTNVLCRVDDEDVTVYELMDLMYLHGETSYDLARRIGVCQTTVSRWLRGCGMPNPRPMRELERVVEELRGRG